MEYFYAPRAPEPEPLTLLGRLREQAGWIDRWTLKRLLAPFAVVRALGYATNPRPYLWWDGVQDVVMVGAFVFVAWAVGRRCEDCYY